MSYEKPAVSFESAHALVQGHFSSPISKLSESSDGQISQTFAFAVAGQSFFLQFHQPYLAQARKTEEFFAGELARLGIPTRKVVGHGTHEGFPYTVSAQVNGVPLSSLSRSELLEALPSIAEVTVRIGEVSLDGTHGYGWPGPDGHGGFDSWASHLTGLMNQNPGDFYGLWHGLFTSTFLDRPLFERYYQKMVDLLPSVPQERCLIHGDLSDGNLFVASGQVTAVLDWQNARFGDPVFDLAYLRLWRDREVAEGLLKACVAAWGSRGRVPPFLDERLRCYSYYLGLDALRFSARTNNRGLYDHVVGILAQLSLPKAL